MYKLIFDESIVFQVVEIYDQLETFREGLGDKFYSALDATYDSIEHNPSRWQWADKEKGYRRKFFRISARLEFVIVYRVIHFDVEILVIRNTSQNNEQWLSNS